MAILSTNYEPGFPAEWEGLDVTSAREAIPHWYGVSSGNGNDGVSHMWPDYYVRTNDPWTLARVAMLASFKPEWQDAAAGAMEIDGEADYTISAVIYNPEDVDPAEAPEPVYLNSYVCPDCGHAWDCEDVENNTPRSCPACHAQEIEPDESEAQERDGDDSYCSANGAWSIVEVFPVDMPNETSSAPRYDSLDECFDAATLAKANED